MTRKKRFAAALLLGGLVAVGAVFMPRGETEPDAGSSAELEASDVELLDDLSYLTDGKVHSTQSPETLATDSNYTYTGSGLKDPATPSAVSLAKDRAANHSNWTNLLYLNGHVHGQK